MRRFVARKGKGKSKGKGKHRYTFLAELSEPDIDTSLAVKVKVKVRANPLRKVKVADATRRGATVKSYCVMCYCRVGNRATATRTYVRTAIVSSTPQDTQDRIIKQRCTNSRQPMEDH